MTYLLNGECNHRGHFAAFRPNALKSSGEPLASSQAADLSDPAPRRAPSIRLSHDNGGLPLLRLSSIKYHFIATFGIPNTIVFWYT